MVLTCIHHAFIIETNLLRSLGKASVMTSSFGNFVGLLALRNCLATFRYLKFFCYRFIKGSLSYLLTNCSYTSSVRLQHGSTTFAVLIKRKLRSPTFVWELWLSGVLTLIFSQCILSLIPVRKFSISFFINPT